MSDLSFHEQILLTLVDKGAIGGILGIAGFYASRLLERYRTAQAIREEVAKERIKRIAPIWEEFSRVRKQFTDVYLQATAAAVSKSDLERAREGFKNLREAIDKISRDVVINRFWLGKALWELHQRHLKDLDFLVDEAEKFFADFLERQYDPHHFDEFKSRVDKEVESRLDVNDVLKVL